MINTDFFFNEVKQTRLFLYENIYNNQILVQNLLQRIDNKLNLFSMNYENNCIKLKIKKTDIKRNENLSLYYYNIFNEILLDFFNENYAILNQCLINNRYGLTGELIRELFTPNLIQNFYTIILVSENIIHIQL